MTPNLSHHGAAHPTPPVKKPMAHETVTDFGVRHQRAAQKAHKGGLVDKETVTRLQQPPKITLESEKARRDVLDKVRHLIDAAQKAEHRQTLSRAEKSLEAIKKGLAPKAEIAIISTINGLAGGHIFAHSGLAKLLAIDTWFHRQALIQLARTEFSGETKELDPQMHLFKEDFRKQLIGELLLNDASKYKGNAKRLNYEVDKLSHEVTRLI